ncbi:helix-turn-helix transcriptional regulator [Parabacteroides sp. AF48-14]|nr:helix-turn-helix transcriptional regulator [Parabacteroides sp. AF48-14]
MDQNFGRNRKTSEMGVIVIFIRFAGGSKLARSEPNRLHRGGSRTASLEDKGMSKKDFAKEIGVSPSRVSDYLNGRSEPTLKIARMICKVLNIPPAVILGF